MDLSSIGGTDKKNRKRLGRGNGSGTGKTSGKGHKGQKARSGGGTRLGFEGGQMPLYRRVPKRGFYSRKQTLGLNQYTTVKLSDLEKFEDGSEVNHNSLKAGGFNIPSKNKAGLKVLAQGNLTKKITLKVNAISKSAQEKIESLGGTVEII